MDRRSFRVLAFWAYLFVLLRITVFRAGWSENDLFSGTVIWVPFQTIFSYLTNGEIPYFVYLFIGNILWFVPFGMYLRLRGMSVRKPVLLIAALSVLIEALQFVFGTGTSELEDVLLNTTGGAIGCACAALYRKLKNPSE